MQWRWYAVPQKKGDPGSETWPNEEMAKHGGGMTWQPVTYDPGAQPASTSPPATRSRSSRTRTAPGDNLFTGSIVALNADTGKMVWYFQSSPHDTHDWDSTQTAVLIDGEVNGQPRKLIAQAARNGHFFLLDRTDRQGDRLVRVREDQLVDGLRREGAADSRIRRRCRRSTARSCRRTRAAPPTGSRRASARRPACSTSAPARAFSIYYIYDPSDNPLGWGGTDRGGWSESMLQAIDYKTGKVRWSHKWEGNARAGLAQHRGQRALHRRPVERSRRAQRHDRRGAVARAPERARQQRPDHLRARRPAVRRRGAGDTLWTFVMNTPRQVTTR